MTAAHIDFETRSAVDLKKAGVYVYAESETTNVWCAAYAVDDEPVKLWTPDHDSRDIAHVIKHCETDVAHNANFERAIIAGVMAPRYGWPIPHLKQWRCTMAMALAMALPGDLGGCADALGLPITKDKEGKALMLRMAKPRKPRKGEPTDKLLWWDDEERLQRLYAYCKQDVEVERQIEKHLLPLRPAELDLWHRDQAINDRGIYVDLPLCHQALKVVEDATFWLTDELQDLTDGAVAKPSNVADLRSWLASRSIYCDKLDKEELEILLARDDLDDDTRRVVEIRKEAGQAAVKKIAALVAGTNSDRRARGLLQFHAALTGRWAGRRFQPQNIRRPRLEDVDGVIETVASGSAEFVNLLYGEPLAAVSDCLRGMVGAAPKCTLYAADFSNIEGRLIAWFAGEEWKIQAFREFDVGRGPDLYKLAYARSFGIDARDVDKSQRQVGKVMELALGYQGGVGAFQKMAVGYGVKVSDDRADELKVAWREAHPNVVQWWYDLENAAKDAIQNKGQTFWVGNRIAFRVVGTFLYMRLPSGRAIVYPFPSIKKKLMPWTERGKMILPATDDAPAVYEQLPVWKDSVCYKGVDPLTHQWTDQFAHGGLLANNAVQGTARDVEAEAMIRVEDAGYPVVLTVHDEVVSETPEEFGSVEEFEQLMTALPTWAEGLPLAASGWKAKRYRK